MNTLSPLSRRSIVRGLALTAPILVAAGTLLTALSPATAGEQDRRCFRPKTLRPGASETFAAPFAAGEQVSVRARGDGNVDLYVYNEAGRMVGQDMGPSGEAVLNFTPRRTGIFTFKVTNADRRSVEFRLCTLTQQAPRPDAPAPAPAPAPTEDRRDARMDERQPDRAADRPNPVDRPREDMAPVREQAPTPPAPPAPPAPKSDPGVGGKNGLRGDDAGKNSPERKPDPAVPIKNGKQ